MTDLKNNLEEAWRKDFEKALDASLKYLPKAPEDHPYDHIRWCWYYEGRKNAQEEIERLRLHHEIKINNAAQIIVTKDNEFNILKQELQKTRKQSSKAEQRIFHAPHCVTNYEKND